MLTTLKEVLAFAEEKKAAIPPRDSSRLFSEPVL